MHVWRSGSSNTKVTISSWPCGCAYLVLLLSKLDPQVTKSCDSGRCELRFAGLSASVKDVDRDRPWVFTELLSPCLSHSHNIVLLLPVSRQTCCLSALRLGKTMENMRKRVFATKALALANDGDGDVVPRVQALQLGPFRRLFWGTPRTCLTVKIIRENRLKNISRINRIQYVPIVAIEIHIELVHIGTYWHFELWVGKKWRRSLNLLELLQVPLGALRLRLSNHGFRGLRGIACRNGTLKSEVDNKDQ